MNFVTSYSSFFKSFPYKEIKLTRGTNEEHIRSEHGSYKGEMFTPIEKTAICESIDLGMKRAFIIEYLGISEWRIKDILKVYRTGKAFGDDFVRPTKLDQQSYNSLPETVKKKEEEQQNSVKKGQLYTIIQEEAVKTDLRRGGNGIGVEILDCRTMEKIIEDTKELRPEKGQTSTKARARESLDVRNFFVNHIMNACYAEGKDPHMIGNFDATQFFVSYLNEEILIRVLNEVDPKLPLSNVEDSILDMFIKFICMCNASGKVATPKKVESSAKKNKEMTKLDLSDNALNEKLIESMKRDHSNLSSAKRAMIAEALVRIVKALSKVMNFSIYHTAWF